MQEWLAQFSDTSVGRLALLWFRRYFEASENSGSAATVYTFLSVGPLVLAPTGLFHAAGTATTAFSERLETERILRSADSVLRASRSRRP